MMKLDIWKGQKGTCVQYLLIAITLLWLGQLVGGCTPAPHQTGDDVLGAWVISQDFVTNNLTNPRDADFPMYQPKYVTHVGNDVYAVNAYVDAKNLFGGTVRIKYSLRVKRLSDRKWRLVDDIKFN